MFICMFPSIVQPLINCPISGITFHRYARFVRWKMRVAWRGENSAPPSTVSEFQLPIALERVLTLVTTHGHNLSTQDPHQKVSNVSIL
uniref:Uncharacterized protein n=1 Tax=Anguilla anguilla TaxID=7936 RepID=A0A0E9W6E8_ANGAN